VDVAEWSGRPAYQQLADDLRAQITGGRIPVGGTLPSVADLMQQHGVSITVVRTAISALKSEGLVTTHQGKGTFVRSTTPTLPGKDRPSPEFREIMHQFDLVQEHVQQLETRLSELEQVVRGREPRSRKSRPRAEP